MGRLEPNSTSTTTFDDDDQHAGAPAREDPQLPPPQPEPDQVVAHQTSSTTTTNTNELQNLPRLASPSPPPQPKPTESHPTDDVEVMRPISFPPQSAQTNSMIPNNQIVAYTPPTLEQTKEEQTHPNQHVSMDLITATQFPPAGNGVNGLPPPATANNQVGVHAPAVSQPQVMIVPFVGVSWASGLFDCCQHPRNAIITAVAPCVTFGQIAEILDNGSTSCLTGALLYVFLFLVLCHWNIGVRYRKRMRSAFELAETPVTDRIAHVMFPLCALCQEFRELKHRGYDPFLGYQGVIAGIVHNQSQVMVHNPPANQTMLR